MKIYNQSFKNNFSKTEGGVVKIKVGHIITRFDKPFEKWDKKFKEQWEFKKTKNKELSKRKLGVSPDGNLKSHYEHIYDWEGLTESIRREGLRNPVRIVNDHITKEGIQIYKATDGNHRVRVLKDIYGDDHEVEAWVSNKKYRDAMYKRQHRNSCMHNPINPKFGKIVTGNPMIEDKGRTNKKK